MPTHYVDNQKFLEELMLYQSERERAKENNTES